MKVDTTAIEGMLVLEPGLHRDERGWFHESYNQQAFDRAIGRRVRFVQDNHSRSSHAVLRGLHYQRAPHAQGRLLSVTRGRVFDVALDIRPRSPSFGRWQGLVLDGDSPRQVWLPPGLAHGFLVLSEIADFHYKTTRHHAPQAEGCIRWDDPAIGIEWPALGRAPLLSARDAGAPTLAQALAADAGQRPGSGR